MKELFPDPQDLIPSELQADWVAVPRGAGKWIFVQSFLFGAGVALTAASFWHADRFGWWGLPAALAVMFGNGLWIRRQERRWLRTLPKIECPEQGFDV